MLKKLFPVRKTFLVALVCSVLFSAVALAQSPTTASINISTVAGTQVIAGNTSPITITGMNISVAANSVGTGQSVQLTYGSVNGETPGCSTGQVTLTGQMIVGAERSTGTGNLIPIGPINILGAGSIQIPASSAVCIVTTGTPRVGGILYYNR